MRKIKQVGHNFIGKIVVAVSEKESFGSALSQSCQKSGQSFVFFYVLFQIFNGTLL